MLGLDLLENLSEEIDPFSVLQPLYSLFPEIDKPISSVSSVVDNAVNPQVTQAQSKQKSEPDVDLEDFLASLVRKDKIKHKAYREHKKLIRDRITKRWIEELKKSSCDTQDDTLAWYKNFIFMKLEKTITIKRDICKKRKDQTVTKGVYDEKIRKINATLSLAAVVYEKFPSLKEKRSDAILKKIDNIYLRRPSRTKESKGKPILTNYNKTKNSDSAFKKPNVIVRPLTMSLRRKP